MHSGTTFSCDFETISDVKIALGLNPSITLSNNKYLERLLSNSTEDASAEPELLDLLYTYTRHRRPHTCVEIGTYKGISATVVATAMEENCFGKVYTIDDNTLGEAEAARAQFDDSGLNNVVEIKKKSIDAFRDWGRSTIDLLFIDGDHEYETACIDFALWIRYLSPDGLVVFHDTRTRLLRSFPDDYIYPTNHFDILNVRNVAKRPSGHEWEGCAFVKIAGSKGWNLS